jgi:hypothetical protein
MTTLKQDNKITMTTMKQHNKITMITKLPQQWSD